MDQAGEAVLQLLIGQAHALQSLLAEVGQEHVGPLQQLHHGLVTGGGALVQRDEPLVQVLHVEVGVGVGGGGGHGGAALLTPGIAIEGLYLDDVGAPLGQDTGGHGAGQHGGQLYDLDAFQRFHNKLLLIIYRSNVLISTFSGP